MHQKMFNYGLAGKNKQIHQNSKPSNALGEIYDFMTWRSARHNTYKCTTSVDAKPSRDGKVVVAKMWLARFSQSQNPKSHKIKGPHTGVRPQENQLLRK